MQQLRVAQQLSNEAMILTVAISKYLGEMVECADSLDLIDRALFSVRRDKVTLTVSEMLDKFEQILNIILEDADEHSKDNYL